MKVLIVFIWLLASCSSPQQRMKDCNVDAGDRKGEERKTFLSQCLRNPGA